MKKILMPHVRVVAIYCVLFLIAAFCIFPFWWTVVTAVSGQGNLFEFPPQFWPQAWTLEHFQEVFRVIPLGQFYLNSILITSATIVGKLILCTLAAYALARFQFRAKKTVIAIILLTMILPGEVNFIVNFISITQLGLVDSYLGVVLPNLVTGMSIFLLKQGFEEIPAEIADAARIDGAGEFRIFFKIMLPLIAPWLATVGILTLVETWNDYLWPSLVLSRPDDFPLSSGILYLRGTYGSSTRVIAAGTLLTILPILIAFLVTQRFFMRGLDGAVK